MYTALIIATGELSKPYIYMRNEEKIV